jgi:hypothetical protein
MGSMVFHDELDLERIKNKHYTTGRAMAQPVSRRSLTTDSLHVGFVFEKVELG